MPLCSLNSFRDILLLVQWTKWNMKIKQKKKKKLERSQRKIMDRMAQHWNSIKNVSVRVGIVSRTPTFWKPIFWTNKMPLLIPNDFLNHTMPADECERTMEECGSSCEQNYRQITLLYSIFRCRWWCLAREEATDVRTSISFVNNIAAWF